MKVDNARDMNRLAEEIAQDRPLPLAASRLGLTPARAEYLWNRIIKRLGRQAR